MRFNPGVLIPILAVGGWVVMVLYRMYLAGQAKEQFHRERMAMIERGLVPPPESDPQQFERMMDLDRHATAGRSDVRTGHRRTGIILIGVGAGLSAMLFVTGSTRAWGAGAFLMVLGVAFLVNAMFEAQSPRDQQPRTPTDVPKP